MARSHTIISWAKYGGYKTVYTSHNCLIDGNFSVLHGFNLREGFKPSDFTIPPRVAGNPPLKAGALKDRTIDIQGLKNQYYEAMGFDVHTGAISKERIKALGLQIVLM